MHTHAYMYLYACARTFHRSITPIVAVPVTVASVVVVVIVIVITVVAAAVTVVVQQ